MQQRIERLLELRLIADLTFVQHAELLELYAMEKHLRTTTNRARDAGGIGLV